MTNSKAVRAVKALAAAVMEAVGTEGGPEGIVHLALQDQGATPAQCTELVDAMVAAGLLARRADGWLTVARCNPWGGGL